MTTHMVAQNTGEVKKDWRDGLTMMEQALVIESSRLRDRANDLRLIEMTADRDNLRFWVDVGLCERISWILATASKIVCHDTITLDQVQEDTEYIRALTRIGSVNEFAKDYIRSDGKICLKCKLAYGEANCFCCEECGHDHQSEGSCGAKPVSLNEPNEFDARVDRIYQEWKDGER